MENDNIVIEYVFRKEWDRRDLDDMPLSEHGLGLVIGGICCGDLNFQVNGKDYSQEEAWLLNFLYDFHHASLKLQKGDVTMVQFDMYGFAYDYILERKADRLMIKANCESDEERSECNFFLFVKKMREARIGLLRQAFIRYPLLKQNANFIDKFPDARQVLGAE